MFCRHSVLRFVVFLLLPSLLIGPVLFSFEARPAKAQDEPGAQTANPQQAESESKPQRIFAPHWTTEGDRHSTIYIRNVHISQTITATPSLILAHRTISLPATVVQPLETVAIDVEKVLIGDGGPDGQRGGAVINFNAESAGALSAYVQVLDLTKSVSFSFPFVRETAVAPGRLDAVAWYYSRGTDAFVALQNTTDKEVTAVATIWTSGQPINLGAIKLSPYQVADLKLPSVSGSVGKDSQYSVGVSIEHNSTPGAIIAQGWVVDDAIGFSAPYSFNPPSQCGCDAQTQHLYGAGIEIGSAGGMMGLAPGTTFSPYLAARNRSKRALIISPIFKYDAGGKVEEIALPKIVVGPQRSTLVNLREFQDRGIIPSWVPHGNLDLQYKGEEGALVAELASVDQNGSFVSPVPLICRGTRALHMAYWRTDGDWHSSITVENIAPEANKVEATISYPGGIYVLEKTVPAGESAMISINEIQQSQTPDREGRVIPLEATLGGVNLWAPDIPDGLIVNAMLMNPVTRTCGLCTEPGYVTQHTVSDKKAYTDTPLYYGFDPHYTYGGAFQIWINVRYSYGSQSGDDPDRSTSSNTSVATAGYSTVTPLSPGTSNITAYSRSGYFTDVACSQPGYLSPTSATLTVIQLKIKLDGNDVTNITTNVIVGQRISLTTELLPAGTSMTNRTWTIPGTRVKDYVANSSTGTVTALTSLSGGSIIFYWVDGEDGRQVQFAYKVSGKSFTATTTFNVKRPTASVSTQSGNTALTTAWSFPTLQLALGIPSTPGIRFTENVTIPPGFAGDTQWVQIVSTLRRRRLNSGAWWRLQGNGLLDTTYPYGEGPNEEDSPVTSLTGDWLEATVNDSFQMYLMFKPSTTGAIWVPLRVVTWNWTAGADRIGSDWYLQPGSSGPNPTDADSTTHPVWTGNVANLTWQPESI